MEQHKPVLLSASGYWSTLRPGNADYRMFAKQMTNVPLACGVKAGKVLGDFHTWGGTAWMAIDRAADSDRFSSSTRVPGGLCSG